QRAGILRELMGFELAYVRDALHRARALIRRELLVAMDRQPFLQAELEPVAAGDAISGPVVEVLVSNDGLDRLVDPIGRSIRRDENEAVVEDVEPLVLH